MTAFTWNGASGGWGTAGNWTPAGTPSTIADSAIIDADGTYTVSVSAGSSFVVGNATIDANGATLSIAGTLELAGQLLLTDGDLSVEAGGVVSDGTIAMNGGTLAADGGTLSAVAIAGDIALSDNATLTVVDGLTMLPLGTAPTPTIGFIGHFSTLAIIGTETLDDVVIQFTGAFTSLQAQSGTLTIGQNVTINSVSDFGLIEGDVVNHGAILVSDGLFGVDDGPASSVYNNRGLIQIADSGMFVAASDRFVNDGTVVVGDDAIFEIFNDTTLDNAGHIEIGNGGTFALAGNRTLSELQSLGVVTNDGILDIRGIVDLQSGTLVTVSDGLLSNILVSDEGILSHGTISTTGKQLRFQSGTLSDVVFLQHLLLSETDSVVTAGSFAVLDTTGGPGTITFSPLSSIRVLGSLALSDGSAPGVVEMFEDNTSLQFDNGGTLDNVLLDFRGDLNVLAAADAPIVLGSGLSAQLSGTDVELQGNFVNRAVIAVNGGTTYVEEFISGSTFDNQAMITVGPAMLFVDTNTFLNDGLISVGTDGTLAIGELVAFTNIGTIMLDSGATFSRHDDITLADLSGSIIANGGATLQLSGLLDLQGGTLEIEPTGLFSFIDVTDEGTIANGTIRLAGGTLLSGGTLSGVTLEGTLGISDFETVNATDGLTVLDQVGTNAGHVTINFGATLAVEGGLILTPGTGTGTIDMTSDIGALRFLSDTSLDQTALNVGGDGNQIFVESAVLTVGTQTVVDLSATSLFTYGSFTNLGTIQQNSGWTVLSDWDVGDSFKNHGLLTISGGQFDVDLSIFDNSSSVVVGDTGGLTIGSLTAFSTSGSFVIQGGGVVDLWAATSSTITFDGEGLLVLATPDSFTGLLHDFDTGAELELSGVIIDSASIIGTTLTVNIAGGDALTYQVDPGLAGIVPLITEGRDGTLNRLVMPCFAAGTQIQTHRGHIAVENLRLGDHVMTASGAARRIVWIGYRHIDCCTHPAPDRVHPICVSANAFGPNQPVRDLFLSPDHAVLILDALIPVKHLVNGTTIRSAPRTAISYYHVELDRHDVVLAEGLAVESYLDTGGRSQFANSPSTVQLHPVFDPPSQASAWLWEAFGYTRLVVAGPELRQARAILQTRAASCKASLPQSPRPTVPQSIDRSPCQAAEKVVGK